MEQLSSNLPAWAISKPDGHGDDGGNLDNQQLQKEQLQQQISNPSDTAYHGLSKYIESLLNTPVEESTAAQVGTTIDASQKVHYHLIRHRSRNSKIITRQSGLKKKLAEYQAREILKDKRFSRGRTLDKLKDLKISLTVYLNPSHFKISGYDEVLGYHGPMKRFLQYISDEVLVPEVMDLLDESSCTFYDGGIVVEVHDRRSHVRTSSFAAHVSTPLDATFSAAPQHYDVYRVFLRPTSSSLLRDIDNIRSKNEGMVSDLDLLEMESKILLATQDKLCLDPSPQVGRVASVIEYNRLKFNKRVKKKHSSIADRGKNDSHDGSVQDVLFNIIPGDDKREVHATFEKVSFVEEWRANNSARSAAPSVSMNGDTVNQTALEGKQLVRTLKFTKKLKDSDVTIYTTITIYIFNSGSFEVNFKYGTVQDTSINGRNMKFKLEDVATVDQYIRSLLNYYTKCEQHQLVSDVKTPVDSSVLHQNSLTAKRKGISHASQPFMPQNQINPSHDATMLLQQLSKQTGVVPGPKIDVPGSLNNASDLQAMLSKLQTSQSDNPMVVRQAGIQNNLIHQRLQNVEQQLSKQAPGSSSAPVSQSPLDKQFGASAASLSGSHLGQSLGVSPGNFPMSMRPPQSAQFDVIRQLLKLEYDQVPEPYKGIYNQLMAEMKKRKLQAQQQIPQNTHGNQNISMDLAQMMSQQQPQKLMGQQGIIRPTSNPPQTTINPNAVFAPMTNQARVSQQGNPVMQPNMLQNLMSSQSSNAFQQAAAMKQMSTANMRLSLPPNAFPSNAQDSNAQASRLGMQQAMLAGLARQHPNLSTSQINLQLVRMQQQQQQQQHQNQQQKYQDPNYMPPQ